MRVFRRIEELREAVREYTATGRKSMAYATYGPIAEWDVSEVTDMSELFQDMTTFSEDLSRWSVSQVLTMKNMFHGAASFCCDLRRWDVGKVQCMDGMFWGAISFTSDLSSWNVSNVRSMKRMLWDTPALVPSLEPLDDGGGWNRENLAIHRAHWRWVRVRHWTTHRFIAFYWLEQNGRKTYGPSGAGRKRDLEEFRAEWGDRMA